MNRSGYLPNPTTNYKNQKLCLHKPVAAPGAATGLDTDNFM